MAKKRKHRRISLKQIKACQVCLATPSLAPGRRPPRRQRKKQKHNRISLKQIKACQVCLATPSQALRPDESRPADSEKTKARSVFPETDQSFARIVSPHQTNPCARPKAAPQMAKKRKHRRISLKQIKACQVCPATSSQPLRPAEGRPADSEKNESTAQQEFPAVEPCFLLG